MPPLDQRLTLREVTFAHGPTAFRLTLPHAADELIDERAFAEDERLPYWADLWPSAKSLARYLLDYSPAACHESGAARAIELGCGAAALASLALALRGWDVLATDYEQAALDLAAHNAEHNGSRLRTLLLDWRNPPRDFGRLDLILAADVLYEQRNAVALADAVPALLTPRGRMILADPGRRYLSEFQARMHQRGWAERELTAVTEPHDDPTKPPSRVRIIEFRRQPTDVL